MNENYIMLRFLIMFGQLFFFVLKGAENRRYFKSKKKKEEILEYSF